jgi:hypothetical protein
MAVGAGLLCEHPKHVTAIVNSDSYREGGRVLTSSHAKSTPRGPLCRVSNSGFGSSIIVSTARHSRARRDSQVVFGEAKFLKTRSLPSCSRIPLWIESMTGAKLALKA